MHQKSRSLIGSVLSIGFLISTLLTVGHATETTNGTDGADEKTAITEMSMVELAVSEKEKRTIRLAAENETLRLYIDEETAEIALENKTDGRIIWSNPQDDFDASSLDQESADMLESQVILEYLTASQVAGTFTSKADCIDKDQFTVFGIPGGARVEMVLGRIEGNLIVPEVIGRETFENEILKHIESGRDRSRLLAFYRLLSKDSLSEQEYNRQKALYPILETQDIYVFRGGSDVEKRLLEEVILSAGFTKESMEKAYEEVNYKAKEQDTPLFELAVEYILEDDAMIARLDASDLRYDESKFILNTVTLLPYFGAQNTEINDGDLLVPDGSGAIVKFGPDISLYKQNRITGYVYGSDLSISNNAFYGKKYTYHLPVFGIRAEGSSFLAILEEGAATAAIVSFTSDGVNPYAGSMAQFLFQASDNITEDSVRYSSNRYEGTCQIRYCPLSAGNDDYVNMAARYRRYLEENGVFKEKVTASEPPLYLETLGTLQVNDRVMGINTKVTVPFSTFEDAQQMLRQFKGAGVSNLHLRYLGWNNGGLLYRAPSRLKVESKLGGKSGLKDLTEYTTEAGIGLYPDVDFRFVRRDSWFDGFGVNNDAVQQLDGTNALHMQVNTATLESDKATAEYIITPSRLSYFVSAFLKKYNKLNITGLSVGSLGSTQTSEHKQSRAVDLEEARLLTVEAVKQLSDSHSLMTDGGNAYIWPYVDHILKVPMESSRFAMETESVPFIAIVLHGYLEFAGEAANLQTDFRQAVLKAAETGSGLYVTLACQNLNKLDSTRFADYYSIDYTYWKKEVEAAMMELKEIQTDTCGLPITAHKKVGEKVYATTFGESITIYVNYGDTEQTVGEHTISGKGMVAIHEK